MANTSATGGYLPPPPIANDSALRNFIQTVLVGVTGLDKKLVRPAFQLNPPPQPDPSVNWCGFSIGNVVAEPGVAYIEPEAGANPTLLIRHESFEVTASFYGPSCSEYAAALRDGLEISQNREQLYLVGMNYAFAGPIIRAPELFNERWYDRQDMVLTFRREVVRQYPILTFINAGGEIRTETYTTSWSA